MTDVPHINEALPRRIPDGQWIDANGNEVWVKDGKWHREDGPAVTFPDSRHCWMLHGKFYNFGVWLEVNDKITDEQKVMLKLEYG